MRALIWRAFDHLINEPIYKIFAGLRLRLANA